MAAVPEFLLQLYNHVVLPRDVPGKEDSNLCDVEAALLDRLLQAVEAFPPFVPPDQAPSIDALHSTLTSTKAINIAGTLDKGLLAKELDDLNDQRVLLLYVNEQNASVLVYRDDRYVCQCAGHCMPRC